MKTRSLLAIPLLVLLLLAAAACGGGSDDGGGVASLGSGTGTSSSETNSDGNEGDQQQALVEFAECMRKHGIDLPDPDADGRMTFRQRPGDEQKFEAAQRECQDLLPQGAGPQMAEEDQQVMQEAALAFARCMREEGVDMPDPTFGEGGGLQMMLPRGVRPDDPTFKAAQKKCQPIMQEAERRAGLEGPGPSTNSEGPGT
jgi:hypothetical protein